MDAAMGCSRTRGPSSGRVLGLVPSVAAMLDGTTSVLYKRGFQGDDGSVNSMTVEYDEDRRADGNCTSNCCYTAVARLRDFCHVGSIEYRFGSGKPNVIVSTNLT